MLRRTRDHFQKLPHNKFIKRASASDLSIKPTRCSYGSGKAAKPPRRQSCQSRGAEGELAPSAQAWRRGRSSKVGRAIRPGACRAYYCIAGECSSGSRPDGEADSLLLLKMAFLVREHPERSLHSIAIEVARDAQSRQKVRIALESLTSKLRRDFAKRRQVWLSLARNREVPNERAMHEDASRRRSGDENRILGRLINLLPDAIDLYTTCSERHEGRAWEGETRKAAGARPG